MAAELNVEQLPPELLPRMLFVMVAVPAFAMVPPKLLVLLLAEKVLLVTLSVPVLAMAPPMPVLLLAEKLLLVTVRVSPGPLAIAPPPKPPPAVLLPEKVLLVTLSVPELAMAPPKYLAL